MVTTTGTLKDKYHQFWEAIASHPDQVRAHCAPSLRWMVESEPPASLDNLVSTLMGFWLAFPDFGWNRRLTSMNVTGHSVTALNLIVVTHDGIFESQDGVFPPTRRPVTIRWHDSLTVDRSSVITRLVTNFHYEELIRQLR